MSYKKPINLTVIYTAAFTVILVLLIAGLSFWSIQKHKEEQTTELLATSRAIAKHLISNVAYKNNAVVLPFHTGAGTKIEFKINNLPETSATDSMDNNYTYKITSKNNSRVFHYEQTILKSEATAPLLLSIDIPMSVSDRVHNKRIRRDIISFITIGLLSIIFISFAFWRLSKRVSHNLYREME